MAHLPLRMFAHRSAVSALLRGDGLEIGASHVPFPLNHHCRIQYFDAMDEHAARALFPEVSRDSFVHVHHVGNLDDGDLGRFERHSFDFIILSHVLEHLSNPLLTIEQVFRILRPGGLAVIAIPDMRFTFDAKRELTSWKHLWSDYINKVTVSSDDHYIDFLRSASPFVFQEPPENLPHHIERARQRREHSHVWTSSTFKEHLQQALAAFNVCAKPILESAGDQNGLEYFSVWEKEPPFYKKLLSRRRRAEAWSKAYAYLLEANKRAEPFPSGRQII